MPPVATSLTRAAGLAMAALMAASLCACADFWHHPVKLTETGAHQAGDKIEGAAKDTGKTVDKAADDTGKAVKRAGKAVDKAASDTGAAIQNTTK